MNRCGPGPCGGRDGWKASGQGLRMIKHIRFMRRRAGVTAEEYREAWIRYHAPMMAERTQALRYYCVSFPPLGGVEQPFHNAVMLWYRDVEHWKRAYSAPPPVENDPSAAMGDRQAGVLLVTDEQVHIDGPNPLATSSWYLRRRTDLAPVEDERRLESEITTLMALDSPPVRLVTSIVREEAAAAPYGALTEIGWATADARRGGDGSAPVRRHFRDAMRLVPADLVIVIP